MMNPILIIEDEEKIAQLLEMELCHEGYAVESVSTGKEGLEKALSGQWSMVLLDVMLPEMSGMEVLCHFRQTNAFTPVILLTARDATSDKVQGLDQGANDYITKPFEMEEVLARIRACLRSRNQCHPIGEDFPLMTVGDLAVNLKTREVTRGNVKIDCTLKEFDLLFYLMENHDRVLTREEILNKIWGSDFAGDANAVDVIIHYLRKKIDYPFSEPLIQTYRLGYSIKGSVK